MISSILVKRRNHPGYAVAILMPVIVCLLFTANQWRKNETGTRDGLASLLFLLAMLYPPFVAARLIYFLIKKDRRWLEAKRNYDTNISGIGKIKYEKVLLSKAINLQIFILDLSKIMLDCNTIVALVQPLLLI
jgi:hypothetical protein